ncbi:MAG TPA: 3-oxoacyl-[acyl-carrier-protein] reductase [Candidatus Hydrogenedentes bacterium]|nr:3-oxoacyl-[acyl-carrier-protein] reductase [Candidatus Hydrogenedentota bacterium]HNT87288.1 3-oxoacyl-[acyl-carrier-protein] reductase [Candidatus Hydrogenedentota bacterium]
MNRFDGKVTLITGGTRGIGLACAQRFAAEGARVALCGRDPERAAQAAADIGDGARGYACDVADPAAVDRLVAAVRADLGPVAILVNNAGLTRDGLLARMKDDDWDAVLRADLTGAFYLCRAVARDMLKQRYGRIINVASVVAIHGQAGQTNYCAAKAGLIGFTKAYAREVASRNITVNAVAPGFIQTEMTAHLAPDAVNGILEQIPLQRLGAPEDVASAVLFLASEDAAYITGAVLPIDGGLGM